MMTQSTIVYVKFAEKYTNDKVKMKVKKKRKKRYHKLWGNCVPLDKYKGNISINQEMVLDRRRRRYEEEKYLYMKFVISQKEEAEIFQATIKDDSLKVYYGKSYEHKYGDLGYESDARIIDQFSVVDGSGVAVEDENLSQKQIRRQSPAIECIPVLTIGTTSLTSGTSPNNCAEEVISSKGFGTFYEIREVFSFISRRLKRKFERTENSLIDSRCFRLDNLDCECEAQTIDQSSTVDGSGVAAEGENLSQRQISRQSPAIECTPNFVIGTTCLTSETNPKSPAEYVSIVSDSRSLEKVSSCSFSGNEVACFSNYSKIPAASFRFPDNLNNSFHARP
jgi:hypothetical protein